jgi:hypothetical protein
MLKLHAGVSKKVGLPGFSSASASCTIEAEFDSSLLQDHEGFQVVVRRAGQRGRSPVRQAPGSRCRTAGRHRNGRRETRPCEPV